MSKYSFNRKFYFYIESYTENYRRDDNMTNNADFFSAIGKIEKVINTLYKQKHIYKNDIEEEIEALYFSLERLKDKMKSEDEDDMDEEKEEDELSEEEEAIINEVDGVVLNILDSPQSLSWLTKNIVDMKDSQRLTPPEDLLKEIEEKDEEQED